MGVFICEKCGNIDNTARGNNYWHVAGNLSRLSKGEEIDRMYPDEYEYFETNMCCTHCCRGVPYSDGSGKLGYGKFDDEKLQHWTDIGREKILEWEQSGFMKNGSTYLKRLDLKEEQRRRTKKKAVIINGFGGVGKDTFVDVCAKISNERGIIVENVSSVDLIKAAAKILGWDGISKTEKDRRFLHELKKLANAYNSICITYMEERFDHFPDNGELPIVNERIIFFHIREPEEMDIIRASLDAKVIYIKNDRVARNENNLEDKDIENYPYDYIIDNSGSIEQLEDEANKFIEWLYSQGGE